MMIPMIIALSIGIALLGFILYKIDKFTYN
jgi:hypothetical protein